MKSVLSQVPECKGPGAPIVEINLHPGIQANRPHAERFSRNSSTSTNATPCAQRGHSSGVHK